MKARIVVLALLLGAGLSSVAVAQQPSAAPATAPGPDAAQLQQARDAAKGPTFDALSPATRAKIQAVVDHVNSGAQTDLRAAVREIGAALTPAEAKAVLAQRTKMIEALHVDDGPPAAADPARFLFNLSVSRDKMRLLHEQETAAKPAS